MSADILAASVSTELPPVLDACCGGRQIWFDKRNPLALYIDKYPRSETLCDGRIYTVDPDQVADCTHLQFPDDSFYHIIFDPPHLTTVGEKSWMAIKYGKLTDGWQKQIHDGFAECMRVLKPYGTLVFKWSEKDITTKQVLEVIDAKPLYGNRANRGAGARGTVWLVFIKDPSLCPTITRQALREPESETEQIELNFAWPARAESTNQFDIKAV